MADPLSSSEGSDEPAARRNFVGRIEFSRVECDCEHCQKGEEAKAKSGEDWDDYDYQHLYKIQPLSEYNKPMSEFGINASDRFASKWMVFIGHLENLHGNLRENDINSLEELGEFLTGRVYEFRDITWEEDEEFDFPGEDTPTLKLDEIFDGDFQASSMLVPVREVADEDELADLGENEVSDEVEEIPLE